MEGTEMNVKNNMLAILNAINDYAFNCGLETNSTKRSTFTLSSKTNEAPSGGTNGGGFSMMGGCSAHSVRNDRLEKEQRNPPHLHSITSTQAGEAF